jgi:excisionase family DNA binding protein
MAGKFLTPDEAAKTLGISVDDVTRLVERKELFPVRDGASVKYKVDDVERYKARAAEASGVSGLSLDLDLPTPASTGPAGSAIPAAGRSGGSGAGPGGQGSGLSLGSGLALDGGSGADSIFAGDSVVKPAASASRSPPPRSALDDLELDDLVIGDDVLSGPSPGQGQPAPAAGKSAVSGLSNVGKSGVGKSGVGGGSLVIGSAVRKTGSGPLSSAGSALSGVLDSGLSLEDDDAAESGIDVAGFDDSAAAPDGATALGSADDFELTAGSDEEESGSVVIAAESESGESSFFGTAMGEDGSSAFSSGGDLSVAAGMPEAAEIGDAPLFRDMGFSVWQICGLVCCSLLLLTGGFVMFDLVRTLGSPEDLSLSNPILNPLADVFGWR